MFKKIPIRLRLTLLSVLLLSLCCIMLTIVLNFSASRMASTIEATLVTPSKPLDNLLQDEVFSTDAIPLETLTPLVAAKSKFFEQSIFYVFLVVALGGLLTYFVARQALKPLQELSRQMKNRTIHNLSESLPVLESRDEISDLTSSFNEMSKKLEEAFAMQKRFSQSAAHELRTPLTVLKTKVEVFNKKNNHSIDDYDKLLLVVTNQTNRLAELVCDLLDLTNTDDLSFDDEIDLSSMLLEVVDELFEVSTKNNVTCSVAFGDEKQIILGNKSLLHRSFYNLVENAIKYNVENGKVDISIEMKDKKNLICISDTGAGIPIELRELIFEPFYRVDKSRSRQMGGAGLGLSIVKAIIEKHNGEIAVKENTSGGTVFEVIL